MKPAPTGHGIRFRRIDLEDQPFIPASVDKVQMVERATTLAEGSVKVHTVEHVISALAGMGVDNALIEMDANEPPIGDGSAAPYVECIKAAGILKQDQLRSVYEVREPIHVETAGGSLITIVPDRKFRISCTQVGPDGRYTQYFSTEINSTTVVVIPSSANWANGQNLYRGVPLVDVTGDTVNLSGTASGAFANKNVGTAKTVTVSGLSLTGAQAGNYSLTQPASLTANITKANLAVSGLTASHKVFNGNTAVTLTGTASVTPLLTDNLSLGGVATGVTADANAGSAKAVTVSGISLVGQDAGNYTLVPPSGLTINVAKASLLLTANDFVSSNSATPSLLGQSGCAVSNCISSIGLSGAD
jgi:hypothetical protein